MKIVIFYTTIFFLFLFSFEGKSQAVISTESQKSKDIKVQFSENSVKVFQQSSQSKVKDFYEYLGLLTSKTLSEELRKQTEENIYSLVENKNIEIIDFTSAENAKINLQALILKLMRETYEIKFVVKSEISFPTSANYWLNSYLLEIHQNNKIESKKIEQKVYFSPQIKSFGSEQKEVWVISLGEISLKNGI